MHPQKMHRRSSVRRRRPVRAGFTLMEVLLVLAILVVLASLVVMNFDTILGGVDEDSTRTQIEVFEKAIQKYKLDMRTPPNTLEDLVQQPADADTSSTRRWRGPYLDSDTIPMDAWQNAFEMQVDENGKVLISSAGADRQMGTEDDITNQDN